MKLYKIGNIVYVEYNYKLYYGSAQSVQIIKLSSTEYRITGVEFLDQEFFLLSTITDLNGDAFTEYSFDSFLSSLTPNSLSSDFGTKVALGEVSNFSSVIKFGRNGDIDIATAPEDITEIGGLYTGQPIGFTPERVNVKSTSALDSLASTGARTIRVLGLKEATSTEYESEDITLNGTSNVLSVNSWYRINRAFVLTAGSTGANQGILSLTAQTTTSVVFAKIPAEINQTQVACYTVPFGKKGLIKRPRVSITRANGSPGSAQIILFIRNVGGVFRGVSVFEVQTGNDVNFNYISGIIAEAGSDIKFQVKSVSDNNTIVDAAFEMFLIDS